MKPTVSLLFLATIGNAIQPVSLPMEFESSNARKNFISKNGLCDMLSTFGNERL